MNRSIPLRFARALMLVGAAALLATACGASGGGEKDALVATENNTAPPLPAGPTLADPNSQDAGPVDAPAGDLPDVELINVVNGEARSLASLVPSDRPLLLWFWAPH
jgi:hypothetical protein